MLQGWTGAQGSEVYRWGRTILEGGIVENGNSTNSVESTLCVRLFQQKDTTDLKCDLEILSVAFASLEDY